MTDGVDIGARGHVLYFGQHPRIMRLQLAEPGDELKVKPRADFAEALASEGGRFPAGPRWVIEQDAHDGVVKLGVAGLEPLGDGRWGAWAYLRDLTPRQWAFAAWSAWHVLQWAKAALDRPRIQAVPAATPQAVRLLKRIGFVDVGEAYMVWEG